MLKHLHQIVHVGSGLSTSPTGLASLRQGSAAQLEFAADYRRLQVMVAASHADALAKAAGTPFDCDSSGSPACLGRISSHGRMTRCRATCVKRKPSFVSDWDNGGWSCCGREPVDRSQRSRRIRSTG